MNTPLNAISPLDGRYQELMEEVSEIFGEGPFLIFRSTIELKWLQSLASLPQIPTLHAKQKAINLAIKEILAEGIDPEGIKKIERKTRHDVKAIEYFLREKLCEHNLEEIQGFLHFGLTSEDINNLAYAFILEKFHKDIFLSNLTNITKKLRILAHEYAVTPMLGRTHGQPATPTTFGKELANFLSRLEKLKDSCKNLSFRGKCNGAVGNFNALRAALPEIDWLKFAENFVTSLGFEFNPYTTQIEPHDYLVTYSNTVAHCNAILIGFCRDMWGYISVDYLQQKVVADEVGSSVMPHKVNPIDFENAEGNLGIANTLLHHFAEKLPISRWQRDLSDSTVLRNLGVAFGHSILAYKNILVGLNKVYPNKEKITAELNNHPEIIAEAIQTIMRLHGNKDAYEQLKSFTRGKKLTDNDIKHFIETLGLPDQVKKDLLKLSPSTYLGFAIELAKKI